MGRVKMTPDEIREELAVLECTLKKWGEGNLTTLENGKRITTRQVAAWRRRIKELRRRLIHSPVDPQSWLKPVQNDTRLPSFMHAAAG
jgi:hypothetical protein